MEQNISNGISEWNFAWAMATDKGKVREQNEDSCFADPEVRLFLVADGMGGHQGGELASAIVVEDLPVMIETQLYKLKVGTPKTIHKLLRKAIARQSRQVHLEGTSETGYRNMGATLVIVHIRRGRCFIANIGDSRAYRLRKGRLAQLSRDHSVIAELIENGNLHPDDAEYHYAQGQITRYIGMEEKAHSHVRSFLLQKNDRLLLCTDGLTDMVDDRLIKQILTANTEPQSACDELIKRANGAGGYDNITVAVIDWLRNGTSA